MLHGLFYFRIMSRPEKTYDWVLGATGYVGLALSESLLEERPLVTHGHRQIKLRLMERSNFLMSSLEELDLDWFRRFPPRVIYHCARLAGNTPARRKRAAERGRRANQRIIEFLKRLENKPSIIYCSGSLMYGPQKDLARENSPLSPIAYARQYQLAEKPWLEAQGEGILDVRMLRPAWILGPNSWFYHFFYQVAQKQSWVPYYGDGQQQMSILSLADCAGQIKHAYLHGQKGQNYNLFSLPPLSQYEFSKKLASLLHLEVRPIPRKELEKSQGKTIAEALCSHIPVDTLHRQWHQSYDQQYRDLSGLLSDTIAKLEAYSSLRKS